MSRWRILDGPTRQTGRTSDPGDEWWVATLENVNDPAQHRFIGVEIPRGVRQSDQAQLLEPIRSAVETNGYSAIERYLNMREPPDRVVVGPTAILPEVEVEPNE